MKRILQYISLGILAMSGPLLTSCQSTPSKPSAPTSTPTYSRSNPKVTIYNNRSKSLGVRVQGPETRFVYLPAYNNRTVTLRPGAYRYAAVSKNTRSMVGTKYFASGKIYTWKFTKK